jgi:hypothetical protein
VIAPLIVKPSFCVNFNFDSNVLLFDDIGAFNSNILLELVADEFNIKLLVPISNLPLLPMLIPVLFKVITFALSEA